MKAEVKPRINLDGRTALETVIPLATPYIVFVDPASSCNFKCVFCPTGHHDLIAETGRFNGVMKFDVFQKIIDDLGDFDKPIKVLRLYKDGEPFLNKRLADMIYYAKRIGHVDYVDLTTNGSLISPERLGPVLEAGLDKINVSVDGMTEAAYEKFTGVKFDFKQFVENVEWLYANKGQCEVVVKTLNEIVTEDQRKRFFDTFGDHADRIFVENFAPCWPQFDIEKHTGVIISKGLYDNEIREADVCPYIFYGYAVNADGLVSSCFQDWGRKLIIGDVRKQSMKQIWNSDKMNALRLQHLEGKRRQNPVCGNCGQITHCLADNIDAHRLMLLNKFVKNLQIGDPFTVTPGVL
jgi:radical SAM protein with 4Fe4S-binding SPASM domain